MSHWRLLAPRYAHRRATPRARTATQRTEGQRFEDRREVRRHSAQPLSLLDVLAGNVPGRLAIVVARAAGDEAGVERRADHKLHVALTRHGKDVVERVRMVDQRVLRREQAHVRIGLLHDAKDGFGRVHTDAPALMIPSSRIFNKAGKAPLSAIANCSCQGVGSNLLSGEMSCTNAMSSRLTPMRCKLSSIERRTPADV